MTKREKIKNIILIIIMAAMIVVSINVISQAKDKNAKNWKIDYQNSKIKNSDDKVMAKKGGTIDLSQEQAGLYVGTVKNMFCVEYNQEMPPKTDPKKYKVVDIIKISRK